MGPGRKNNAPVMLKFQVHRRKAQVFNIEFLRDNIKNIVLFICRYLVI